MEAKSNQAYQEAYGRLNDSQREAVDSIDGPVMVLAGPGTGKTQVLTLRIANILLKTDTPPESVLALTFTESGAKAMRQRLLNYIGSTAYQVSIFTFHSFAQHLIGNYPDAYHRVVGGRPATDIEKISIIESILEDSDLKLLRPLGNPRYYVDPVLRMISDLKKENVDPDGLASIISTQEEELMAVEQFHTKGAHKGKVRGEYQKLEKIINKNRELNYVYRLYEAYLNEHRLYDFDDMIIETVKALESDEDMLRDLQERFLYLLADEHQDVNGSQNKILDLLSSFHDSPNIFAVGDEKQAIFRFQGASLENFLYFTEHFKDTKVISLTENYRSGPEILSVTHSLVETEDEQLKPLRIELQASLVKEAEILNGKFTHQVVEDQWLVKSINELVKSGVSPSEIAVILRTNREVELVTKLIRQSGIPATASAESDILQHPITQSVKSIINLIALKDADEALFNVMHGPYWGIDSNDLIKIFTSRSSRSTLWSIVSDQEKLKGLELTSPERVSKIAQVVEETRKLQATESPHRVLEYFIKESGFLDYVVDYSPLEGARVMRRLYDEIEEFVVRDGVSSLSKVSELLATRSHYNLPLNAPFIETKKDSVKVMTAHKSKGLEFEAVFIPHLNDRAWSGSGKKTNFKIPLAKTVSDENSDPVEDERRLLYVAMTRAKNKLFLTVSETNSDGKELVPARLLSDLNQNKINVLDVKSFEDEFNPLEGISYTDAHLVIDKDILITTMSERGFSATSINNYLRSPWDYFYRNILRFPEVKPVHMEFGTAIHNTLEFVTKEHTSKQAWPSFNEVKNKLEIELNRLPLSDSQYDQLLEKGLENLTIYLDHLKSTKTAYSKEELSIRVMFKTGLNEIPEIPLTGKIDRLDFDDSGKVCRVIDYKTGKPKTRNEILGQTKNSEADYYRQLVFYTLILKLYGDEKYACNVGALSFVEPGSGGQIKEEQFEVAETDVKELEEAIIASVKDYVEGEFLHRPCDPDVSKYCDLASSLIEINKD